MHLRRALQVAAVSATGVGVLVNPIAYPIALTALAGLAVTATSRQHKYDRAIRHYENKALASDLAARSSVMSSASKLDAVTARKSQIMRSVHPLGWLGAFIDAGLTEQQCQAELIAANVWLQQHGFGIVDAEVLEQKEFNSDRPTSLPRIATDTVDAPPDGATLIKCSALNNVNRYPVVMLIAPPGSGKSATMGAIMRELSGWKAIASPKPLNNKMQDMFDLVYGCNPTTKQWLNWGVLKSTNCAENLDLSLQLHKAQNQGKLVGSMLDFLWHCRRESMNRMQGTTENKEYWRCFFDEASYTYTAGFNDPQNAKGSAEKDTQAFISGINKDAFQNFRGQKIQYFLGAQVETVESIGLKGFCAAKDEAWFLYPGLKAIAAAEKFKKPQLAQWLKRRVNAGYGVALLEKEGVFFEVLDLPTIAELSALVEGLDITLETPVILAQPEADEEAKKFEAQNPKTEEANDDKGKRFSSEYKQYLASPEWQERRDRIKPKVCAGCHTKSGLQLHHRVYPPRGASLQEFITQPDTEFTWLCEPCHKAITRSMRSRR